MPLDMATSLPADPSQLHNAAAVAFAHPHVLVSPDDGAAAMLAELAATYYGFWNNGSTALFEATVSPGYTDCTLPVGRQQGPSGLADAGAAFFAAFPDGRVKVLQQMLVGVVSSAIFALRAPSRGAAKARKEPDRHARSRTGTQGAGQAIDYLATDTMRVANGLIVEN